MTRSHGGPEVVTVLIAFGLSLIPAYCALAQTVETSIEMPPLENRLPGVLNVSIPIFDAGVPQDLSVHREQEVFPRIRDIEALFLPFVLRRSLHESGEWGAVRVVPELDPTAELIVAVRILRSDGEALELEVRAIDASGRSWIDKTYSDGFTALQKDIGRDLEVERAILPNKALTDVVDVSLVRYAARLVPTAFGGHVEAMADGGYVLRRLPARTDPMLGRIHRLRTVEYGITDAVDEKFEELYDEVSSTYALWQEYRQKFREFQRASAERALADKSDAEGSSYESMMDRYQRYKWDRQAVQEQDAWAVGFGNEVGPTIRRIEERIGELEGWVDQEYATWERILAEFHELETGFEPQ